MALDEAMLEAAARGEAAYLRFYGWTVPTLSLGYFQRLAEVQADPRWQGVPIVRRPTGGGAIWHHHEVTYAIAVPPGIAAGPPEYGALSGRARGDRGVLADVGVPARRRGGEAPTHGEPDAERPFLCFTDRDPEDIVCERS